MSYYQNNTYQPPQRGWHDEQGQYHHPTSPPAPPPAQNGGYPPTQYSQAPQYPGQPAYDPYGQNVAAGGGPVQQPYQEPYDHSPRTASFQAGGGGYGAPPPQQQQYAYEYNPAHYAPPQTPVTAQGAHASYNPAAYAPAQSPSPYQTQQQFGYTPPTSYAGYQPSPPATQQQFPQYSPQPPSRQFSHSQNYPPPLPQRQQSVSQYGYAPQPPVSMPDPYQTRPHSQSIGTAMQVPQIDQYHSQISPALPGLVDENWRPSPPTYQLNSNPDTRQSPSPLYQTNTHNSASFPSPPTSITPGPTPPAHGGPVSRSNTLDRHPSRPLPAPPERDYFGSRNGSRTSLSHQDAEAMTQEELFSQVENAVLQAGRGHSPSISVSRPPYSGADQPNPLFAAAPNSPHVHRNGSIVNGHLSPAPDQQQHQMYSSDSDAEGTQGLAMLQEAEQEDWRGSGRFSSYGGGGESQQHSRAPSGQQPQHAAAGAASDSDDYAGYDMTSFAGPDVQMSYGGNDPSQLVTHSVSTRSTRSTRGDANGYEEYSRPVSQQSSMRRSHASQSSHLSRGEYDYSMDSIHPFPPFNPAARVDVGGSGGLSEPTGHGRRQSYDEGDEYALMEGQLPERFPDEPPDIFFQQASTSYASSRPLPAVPGESAPPPPLQTDLKSGGYPHAPDAFGMNAQGQWVPRSTSLISHSATPQITQPLRSKTDAEERRLRAQGVRSSVYTPSFESTPASSVVPDLPSLGAKRFVPSKLGAADFKKCDEPWSLMGMLRWLLTVVDPGQYTELKEAEVKEALVALFTNKVPTMNIADAEGLSNHVVASMYAEGTLVATEEWVKLVPGRMAGVIYQLTGHGCYAATVHDHVIPGRCYSHHCQRTLRKVNLATQPTRSGESWVDYYGLKKEDMEGKDKKELERQNVLHEIVTSEEKYMEQLHVLRTLYRDTLAKAEPSVIPPKRREKFVADVFGRVDAVIQANEEHLLAQLKYRQQEQGPWIVGFSDIFRQWIRKAKAAYLEYSCGFPGANYKVRSELDRNLDFRAFVDRVSKDKRSLRLQWDTFLKAPITRLQRYTLLLQTVTKNIRGGHLDAEKKNLQIAFDEVRNVTLECDTKVAEMQRRVDLSDLQMKLMLRPGMQEAVELGLEQVGRQLIHRGDLQRMGGNSGNKFTFTWLDTHAILFDHYLVIAKTSAHRSEQGGKVERYDVSRLPIPMDLLILEETNAPAVQKSSYVKGFTSVTTVTGRGPTPDAAALARMPSDRSGGPGPGLQHVNTGASANSLQTVTSLGEGGKDDRIMWPFKIKHLGREIYTLFAPTEQARKEWCTKIREAKAKHAAALFAQHAEPFRLRVMADAAFVYDAFGLTGGQRADVVEGTPVDRAIKEVELRFKDTGRPGPICRARVNCATSFGVVSAEGGSKQMVAVGTDFGVFVSEMDNPRGWTKSIPMVKVTQIAVLEDFNLFLLITDKSLIAYPLDVICPSERSGPTTNDSARKAPQKLSGSRDVGLFAVGRQKDRTLVFYKKRENLNSVFKVLEPIYQKSTERRRGAAALFRKGNYEFFREFDEFYIPAECTGMNLFHSSLAVSTARGFEVLTLDKKQPWSVPDLRAQEVQNIAAHIKDQRALGMLRLSDQEFLLCYSNCAVYINKHCEVSRSVIMDFVGTANSATLYGPYLVLFDSDFVEIRNAQNGRLKQIIAGREIKCLDDGGSMPAAGASGAAPNGYVNGPTVPGSRTVKFVMQHPEAERTQIVVELLLNEDMKE